MAKATKTTTKTASKSVEMHGKPTMADIAAKRVEQKIANTQAELGSESYQALATRQAIVGARRRLSVSIAVADESAQAGLQRQLAQARALATMDACDLDTLRAGKEVLRSPRKIASVSVAAVTVDSTATIPAPSDTPTN